jgi:hypothetical protein
MTNYNKTNLNIILTIHANMRMNSKYKNMYVDEIQFIMCKYMENETQSKDFGAKFHLCFCLLEGG